MKNSQRENGNNLFK